MQILENVPISRLTTMRLGGFARYVIYVKSAAEVEQAYLFAQVKRLPVYVLGAGANTIGRDEGFPGVIIISEIDGIKKEPQPDGTMLLRGGSGLIWDDFVASACAMNLTGIEALSAIPGKLGAAPVQNIGAYGQEIANVIAEVKAYDTQTGTMVTLRKEELGFAYRKSIFNSDAKHRYFITEVAVQLQLGHLTPPFYPSLQKYLDEHNITEYSPKQIREAVTAIRAAKLPDPAVIPSAGSFFKNIVLTPPEVIKAEAQGIPVWNQKINTGWLIEQCDLKGKVLHGMRVSNKAALILINDSAKGYDDLAAARTRIQEKVFKKFGYQIEQEPEEIPSDPKMPRGVL